MSDILHRFQNALLAHDRRASEPWTGPYHFNKVNDAISDCIREIDPLLRARGLWPEGRRFIGNLDRLRLLAVMENGE